MYGLVWQIEYMEKLSNFLSDWHAHNVCLYLFFLSFYNVSVLHSAHCTLYSGARYLYINVNKFNIYMLNYQKETQQEKEQHKSKENVSN